MTGKNTAKNPAPLGWSGMFSGAFRPVQRRGMSDLRLYAAVRLSYRARPPHGSLALEDDPGHERDQLSQHRRSPLHGSEAYRQTKGELWETLRLDAERGRLAGEEVLRGFPRSGGAAS